MTSLRSFLLLSHLWRGRLPEGRLRGEISNGGLIWLYLAPFTPSGEAENEAGVVSFGSRSLVRAEPAWPRCGLVWPWLRIRGRGWEWPGVTKLLIRFHLLPFRPTPCCLRGRGCEVPAFAGTTERFRRSDACNHCTGWRGDAAMGICRRAARCSRSRWLSRQQ